MKLCFIHLRISKRWEGSSQVLGGFSLPLPLRWARETCEFLLSLSGGVACDTSTRTGGTGAQNVCMTLSLPVQKVTVKLKPLNMTNASNGKQLVFLLEISRFRTLALFIITGIT